MASWQVLLVVLASVVAISLLFPATRRLWDFVLTGVRYIITGWLTRLGVKTQLSPSRPLPPQQARLFCEDMGATFVKFGQIIASSSGMFPDDYVAEFQRVLDNVKPFPFADVDAILKEELGDRYREFAQIDPKPLASASIAQVHTAVLADGSAVVVKVQRPGIAKRCSADVKIMKFLAGLLERFRKNADLLNPRGVVDDFAMTLSEELDFRKEAENLRRFNEIMQERGQKNIRAPRPMDRMTSKRVLVMERFVGLRVDRYADIQARGIDGESKLVAGLRAWFQCVVFYGFFHGDVHAGNLMLLDDGDVGFLDFGIVGRFNENQRHLVTDYMIAFASGNYKRLAEVICEMTGKPPGLDMERFTSDLGEVYGPLLKKSFGEVNYAEVMPAIQKTAARHRVGMPKEFILITKQFLYFDRYAKTLAPKLNVFTDPRLVLGMMGDIQKARAEQAQNRA